MSTSLEDTKAKLFFDHLTRLHQQPLDQSLGDEALQRKVYKLFELLKSLYVDATDKEKIQFSNLFTRISYAGHEYGIAQKVQFYAFSFQRYAKAARSGELKKEALQKAYSLGLKAVAESIAAIFDVMIPENIKLFVPSDAFFRSQHTQPADFKANARVQLIEDNPEEEYFLAQDKDRPDETIKIRYNQTARNELFNPTIGAIRLHFTFPLTISLLDIEICNKGDYYPKAFVIEPDFLIDITAVSECFQATGTMPVMHILKKFLPFQTSKYLMLGNIANFFLDELMNDPDIYFKATFPKVFRLNPLAFSLMPDREVLEIYHTSQKHFLHLKQLVKSGFLQKGIENEHCFLEPSFFSERYGLQGRLDVFYKNDTNGKSAIVELKSGKPFRANTYGLSHNHYIQTLLYDLLIKSTFGKQVRPTNYILYSGIDHDHLKFAPVSKSKQYEALEVRNQLMAYEQQLQNILNGKLEHTFLFSSINSHKYQHVKGYLAKDILLFEKTISDAAPIERLYFAAFSSFLSREHRLAKLGAKDVEGLDGHAALWLQNQAEKEEAYTIISGLKLESIENEVDFVLYFNKTEQTNPLANFRTGDIAVLYPLDPQRPTVLHHHIFKGTIVTLTDKTVAFRLRSKQFNTEIFQSFEHWNLEHDLLDSSFLSNYRALFAFLQAEQRKKNLLLTKSMPAAPQALVVDAPDELTSEQQAIFKKIIQSQDYFLLWGPPGTGKTSMMLKHLVGYLKEQTKENILLLAYTNRAVDEICEAIEAFHPSMKQQYVRIGSRYSTAPAFHENLLDQKLKNVSTRKDLIGILKKHRIFVATVAGMNGKRELLKLKTFHTVIIDEASQILEPALVGLLPHFKRFVLIGDHKQLPAVVTQSKESSAVTHEDLQTIGLNDLRNSFFERLYKRCIEKEWHWAYAQLSHQGRMHEDIMTFPNEYFYEKTLQLLPAYISTHQLESLSLQSDGTNLQDFLCENRVFFDAVKVEGEGFKGKINPLEASRVVELLQAYVDIFKNSNENIHEKTFGIITPYRAQIAQILYQLEQSNLGDLPITVDTVERYQGGARDVILISLCANQVAQLTSLVSLSDDEKVDRKLNVAMTRARKHLGIIGNPNILKAHPIYAQLIQALPNLTK